MSYTKITTGFKDHETVLTAAHLQHLENGIADNDAALVNRVRTDVSNQGLSVAQKSNARMNIDTPSTAEMTAAVAAEADLRSAADAAIETKTVGIQDEVDQAKEDITDLQTVSSSMIKTKTVTGNPLTIHDALAGKAKKLVVNLEPKQDFHGYDKPWFGGSGKNLLPCDYTNKTISGVSFVWNSSGVLTTSGTPAASLRYDLFGSSSFVLPAGTYKLYGPVNDYPESRASIQLRKIIGSSADENVIAKAGGTNSPVTFTISEETSVFPVAFISNTLGAEAAFSWHPMLIDANEADESYRPYSNTCPIEGYDTVTVTSSGNNMIDLNSSLAERYGITYAVDKSEGSVTLSGTASQEANRNLTPAVSGGGNAIRVTPGEQYFFSGTPYGGGTNSSCVRIVFRNAGGTAVKPAEASVVQVDVPYGGKVYTAPATATFVDTYSHTASNANANGVTLYPFMCRASENRSFKPYQSNTTCINLISSSGSTVYGGSIMVDEDGSGTLVVDRAKYVCGENEDLTYSTTTLTFYHTNQTQLPVQASKNIISAGFEGVSSKFCPAPDGMNDSAWRTSTDYLVGYTTSRSLRFKIPCAGSDVAAAKAIVAGTEVVYKIATPLSYPLTTTQLQTLLGTNHLMTDAGELELTYRTDKYGEIDKLLSAFPTRTAGPEEIVTVDDGADEIPVKDLTVTIEPAQDLHGYDRPWVSGAGKNKISYPYSYSSLEHNGITWKVLSNGTITATGTATGNSQFTLFNRTTTAFSLPLGDYVLNGCPSDGGSAKYEIAVNTTLNDNNVIICHDYGSGASFTVSDTSTRYGVYIIIRNGTTVSNLVFYPMIRLATETDPTYEPYENICPISGVDNVVITNHGKNLLCYEGWKWHTDGQFVPQTTAKATPLLSVDPGDTITASKKIVFSGLSSNCVIRQFNKDKEFVSSQSFMLYNVLHSTYTVPEGIYYVGITQFFEAGQDTSEQKAPYQAQVELGSTPTAYEPCWEENYSVSLEKADTVYGGSLNVLTGELVVDRVLKQIAVTDIKNSSSTVAGRYFSGGNYITDRQSDTPILCNAFAGRASNNTTESGVVYITSSGQVTFNTSFSTLSDFQSWIRNNALYIVYQLATPLTYQLTPQEVSTLLGSNTFSCDAGKITLSYRADPSLLINKLVNALTAYGITV